MNSKGFSLIGLLCIVVILAFIGYFVYPQIINMIKTKDVEESNGNVTTSAMITTAKLIARYAENEYQTSTLLSKDFKTNGSCFKVDWAPINMNDYKECTYNIINDKAIVNLEGINQYEGYYVCNATSTSAVLSKENCQ